MVQCHNAFAIQAAEQAKLLKLDAVVGLLKGGNPTAGRDVFFSEKAKCATCHVVGTTGNGELLGKQVGPDLTTVSIMPKGLDETLTPQQIADMVAWLQTLKKAQ